MKLSLNKQSFDFPCTAIGELREANDLHSDRRLLLDRIGEDGYLLLRNLIDRDKVLRARRAILEELSQAGVLKAGTSLMDGVVNDDGLPRHPLHEAFLGHPAVLAVIDGQELHGFFDFLLGEPSMSLDLKIIRRVPAGPSTGIHYDVVYVGRGTHRRFTCWIPLGDIPVEQGPLAVCAGSNSLAGFEKLRQTYGRHDVDKELMLGAKGSFPGWFSFDLLEIANRYGGQWQTTNFKAGDVIIFTMFTMHCGLDNNTDRFRISSDVRFQAGSEAVDERWMGTSPAGNDKAHRLYAGELKTEKSIDQARQEWGV